MKKYSFLLLITALIVAKIDSSSIKTKQKEKAKNDTETKRKQEFTDLSSFEMDLFNAMLEIKPKRVTHELKKALKSVKEKFKKFETYKKDGKYDLTKDKIIEIRDDILNPLKPFLDRIFKYRDLTKKLVEKSLKNSYPNSTLLKFFDVSKEESLTFFDKNINTAEDIEEACKVFIKFLSDIEHNMSKEAIQAYKDLYKKIKEAKQKKANRQK